jgi:hypothetical protein
MQKLELKSIYILCKNCSSFNKEHNKIGSAIFGFFYDLIMNLQVTGHRGKNTRIYLLSRPWKI